MDAYYCRYFFFSTFPGHREKIYFVKFHPQAKDVLVSSSFDMTVKIWDMSTGEDRITLQGHTDQVIYYTYVTSPPGVGD